MILQVYLKLQHRSTWNFRTIFGQWKCVRRRWSIVTSQQIQDGGRPPFWRSLNQHISVKNRPIWQKFGTLQHIKLNPRTVTCPKTEFLEIQDGGGRHLENHFFGHISSTDCPILAKFCMRKQNSMPTRATWDKPPIIKIQHGGRPPFWKSLNHHISVQKSSNFDEIWYTTADTEPDDSHVTRNWNF